MYENGVMGIHNIKHTRYYLMYAKRVGQKRVGLEELTKLSK